MSEGYIKKGGQNMDTPSTPRPGHPKGSGASHNMKHLWEIKHPYYCNEGNYFASVFECGEHYDRWQDFIEAEGDSDLDMNLVFRFDWEPPWKDGDSDKPIEWQGDVYYRDSVLKLFYIGQRKGVYRWVTVDVCRADEPSVVGWLVPRWEHLQTLWRPLSDI